MGGAFFEELIRIVAAWAKAWDKSTLTASMILGVALAYSSYSIALHRIEELEKHATQSRSYITGMLMSIEGRLNQRLNRMEKRNKESLSEIRTDISRVLYHTKRGIK